MPSILKIFPTCVFVGISDDREEVMGLYILGSLAFPNYVKRFP